MFTAKIKKEREDRLAMGLVYTFVLLWGHGRQGGGHLGVFCFAHGIPGQLSGSSHEVITYEKPTPVIFLFVPVQDIRLLLSTGVPTTRCCPSPELRPTTVPLLIPVTAAMAAPRKDVFGRDSLPPPL